MQKLGLIARNDRI